MNDLSGFGLKVRIIASNTFPAGVDITQFSDDADAVDIPSIKIAETAMGLNGDLVGWSKPAPLQVTLNLIADSDDDKNMAVIAEANRVGKGKQSVRDSITLTLSYPNGRVATYSPGFITDGMPGLSVASAGKMKTRPYVFHFENKTEVAGS